MLQRQRPGRAAVEVIVATVIALVSALESILWPDPGPPGLPSRERAAELHRHDAVRRAPEDAVVEQQAATLAGEAGPALRAPAGAPLEERESRGGLELTDVAPALR
jgi:hypothetical protein